MRYLVTWLQENNDVIGQESVDDLSLGVFIVGLINDGCVVIGVSPLVGKFG